MSIVRRIILAIVPLALLTLAVSCTNEKGATRQAGTAEEAGEGDFLPVLTLPELQAITTNSGKLHVVATTSIIGDVISHVGGRQIDLVVLMQPGEDPHSYEPSAGDLAAVAESDVIFVNGWDLEEGLIGNLENVAQGAPLVPISANVKPQAPGMTGRAINPDGDDPEHRVVDPHVWLDPHLVRQWVENVATVFSQLDPVNVSVYEENAQAYLGQLEALIADFEEQVDSIPADRRKLVTNHDSFGYFAEAYDFEILGTVIPAASTLAEPSAKELAGLVDIMEEAQLCTLFAESTSNAQLAQALSAEVSNCEQVQVVPLFTGALGPAGSDANTYIDMMRDNIDAISNGLR